MKVEVWITTVRFKSFPAVVERFHGSAKEWADFASWTGFSPNRENLPDWSEGPQGAEWTHGSSTYTTHYRAFEIPV